MLKTVSGERTWQRKLDHKVNLSMLHEMAINTIWTLLHVVEPSQAYWSHGSLKDTAISSPALMLFCYFLAHSQSCLAPPTIWSDNAPFAVGYQDSLGPQEQKKRTLWRNSKDKAATGTPGRPDPSSIEWVVDNLRASGLQAEQDNRQLDGKQLQEGSCLCETHPIMGHDPHKASQHGKGCSSNSSLITSLPQAQQKPQTHQVCSLQSGIKCIFSCKGLCRAHPPQGSEFHSPTPNFSLSLP